MRVVVLVALVSCSYQPGVRPPQGDDAAQLDAGDDEDAAMSDAITCPSSYTAVGNSHYRFVAVPNMWPVAEEDCADDGFGSHLAVVLETGELPTIDGVSGASNAWVGASNRSTLWKWVTGEPAPVLSTNPDRCGRYYDGTGGGTAALQASDCTSLFPYLCECDLVAPDPTAF